MRGAQRNTRMACLPLQGKLCGKELKGRRKDGWDSFEDDKRFLFVCNCRFEEGSVKLLVQRWQDPASPGCMDCEFMQPRVHSPNEIQF